MNKVINRKGISLVALIITIIVLIILTAAVVVTGINTPKNTEYAIKMHNHAAVQDAVTLYIMTSMLDEMDNYDPSYIGAYTVKDVDDIVPELYDISSEKWSTNAATKLGINLTQEELQEVFTLDSKGVVGWVEGQEPTLETDEENNQGTEKTLTSISITKMPTKTEYKVGETVSMVGLEVTATYSDGTKVDVTSSVTYTPTLANITVSTGEKEITVTYGGKTATEKVTITVEQVQATFGSQIDANNYGQAVNYSVTVGTTTYTDWQIYYATDEYVFLIKTNPIAGVTLSGNGDVEAANSSSVYNIMKLGQTGYTLDSSKNNSKVVATLLNGYSAYANTEGYKDASGNSYVVGAIGGPTIELVQARANTISSGAVILGTSTNGYTINGSYCLNVSTGLPTGATYIWLASPSYREDILMYIAKASFVCDDYTNWDYGICPVVCLKSSIPATLNGTTWEFGN